MILKHTFTKVTPKYIASLNKDIKECIATDANGRVYEKLTLWKKDWELVWGNIQDGYVLSGEVKETEKNGYKNFTLYPERTNTLAPRAGGAGITKNMEKKSKDIAQAQERKADNIQTSSTFRDATILTQLWIEHNSTIDSPQASMEAITLKWLEFRKWLVKHWDIVPASMYIPPSKPQGSAVEYPVEEINPDDIPF